MGRFPLSMRLPGACAQRRSGCFYFSTTFYFFYTLCLYTHLHLACSQHGLNKKTEATQTLQLDFILFFILSKLNSIGNMQVTDSRLEHVPNPVYGIWPLIRATNHDLELSLVKLQAIPVARSCQATSYRTPRAFSICAILVHVSARHKF